MSNKSKGKKPSGKKSKNPAEVAAALKQMQLSVPQWMAMMEEMKVINLQLKVANNALITEFNRTFEEIGSRIEVIEVKVFGKVQGEILSVPGPGTDAMTLPTEQAKSDAALLKKIQSIEEEVPPTAKTVPLGNSEDSIKDTTATSMFPKAN